jgi:hypothetical protein
MRNRGCALVVAMALAVISAGCEGAQTLPEATNAEAASFLVRAGFDEKSPFKTGWEWGPPAWAKRAGKEGAAELERSGGKRGGVLTVESGMWRGPRVTPAPLSYLELSFLSKADSKGYYGVLYYDDAGNEIPASVYSGILASDEYREGGGVVLVHAKAVAARILFWPRESPIRVDEVRLRTVTAEEALARMDAIYSRLPKVPDGRPDGRWDALPKTRSILENDGTLTIVCIGDSVANDMAHSMFHLLVQRAWPGSRIVFHNEVGSGARPKNYIGGDKIREQILGYDPDLVLFGGMSGRSADIPDLRIIAREIRAAGAEFGAFTGTMLTPRYWNAFEKASAHRMKYRTALKEAGEEDGFAVMDLGTAWDEYVQSCGRDVEFFRRDGHHANDRGKQIYGRLLARWFMP